MQKVYVSGLRWIAFSSLIISSSAATAQSGRVKGRVLNSVTKAPFSDVQVAIPNQKKQVTASPEGYFTIKDVAAGKQMVVITTDKTKNDTVETTVGAGTDDLGQILITPRPHQIDDNAEIPTLSLDENVDNSSADNASDGGNSAAFYSANGDDFMRTTIFNFGPYRFRLRGYGNRDIQLNGMPLQNIQTGYASYNQLGGLNDVMRDRSVYYGLTPSDYSFGSISGSTYINATAADQRKGASVSVYNSDRSFRNRVMASYNSGLNKNGWAYSVAASRRWAQEGYIPGTSYDGMSFYAAVSKVIRKSQFNLTALAAPTYRGMASNSTDEVYTLANNHYYNEDWGLQNGKVRNAVNDSVFQPLAIASYTYKPNDRTRWTTSAGYKFGLSKRSGLDYYNAASPYPTYYRNMPSYALYGGVVPRPDIANVIANQYKANPDMLQIQWDDLYNSNYMNTQTVKDVNGIAGNDVTGKQSLYIIGNKVDNMKTATFNTNITHVVNDRLTIDGGLLAISQYDEYYKQAADLLGGDFFVNYNQFASQQILANPAYNQNNLNNPNALVKVGDKYSYDYIIRSMKTDAWGQALYNYNKLEVFATADLGRVSYSREGLFRNGLFPDNSFGRSAEHSFMTVKAKAGGTYHIDGHATVFGNLGYTTDAPTARNTYISPDTRDFVLDNLKVSKTTTAEAGVSYRAKQFYAKLTGYIIDSKDNTIIRRFYNDDPDVQSNVNYAMQNVNTRSTGLEFQANKKIYGDLSAVLVAAVGESYYANRPTIAMYQDNTPTMVPTTHTVYIQDYYLGVGPQSVYSFALRYNPRGFWSNLSFNYFDRNYVDINPERHTQLATDLVDPNSQQWKDILTQEKLPAAFVVNLSGGKSFDVSRLIKSSRRTSLVVNATINNLLNNQNIKVAGYEQLRYDLVNQNPNKFPNKYVYGYGINYGISVALRF